MESAGETELMQGGEGPMAESYAAMGISGKMLSDRVPDHSEAILSLLTASGNLILVHNTFAGRSEIKKVLERGNTYWCLCPGSNLYIENRMPPVELLREAGASVVLGTDSLASNTKLSILNEMKLIASSFPHIPLHELIEWATKNGAKALGMDDSFGTIEISKRPGLVLLENIPLENPVLTQAVTARRLI